METVEESQALSVNDFYRLQSRRPNACACELFWTGECGSGARTRALYELGIPRAPPKGRTCNGCRRFRNNDVLVEMAKRDYEIERKGRGYECTHETYLDDGYGYYFTAHVDVILDAKGETVKITVDGLTAEGATRMSEKQRRKCRLWKKGRCLAEDDYFNDEDEDANCNDCKYYDMVSQLAEQLDSGGW